MKDIATNPKVELIHISRDRDAKTAFKWAKKEKFPWPVILMEDTSKDLMIHYRNAVPTYVMVDREGKKIATGKPAIWAKLGTLDQDA